MSDTPPSIAYGGALQEAIPTFAVDRSGVYAGSSTTAQTTPKGYQQIANTSLATVQTLSIPTGATRALIQNNGTQNVRYRDDGTAPTSTTGMRIIAGATLDYRGPSPLYNSSARLTVPRSTSSITGNAR